MKGLHVCSKEETLSLHTRGDLSTSIPLSSLFFFPPHLTSPLLTFSLFSCPPRVAIYRPPVRPALPYLQLCQAPRWMSNWMKVSARLAFSTVSPRWVFKNVWNEHNESNMCSLCGKCRVAANAYFLHDVLKSLGLSNQSPKDIQSTIIKD